jgi:hypothetical protein
MAGDDTMRDLDVSLVEWRLEGGQCRKEASDGLE